ncbi:P-type conjugative transfer protein TrbJ [compost metagenome]
MKPGNLLGRFAGLLLVGLPVIEPATAVTVIDPTNLVQNTLTALRTLEMTNNQVDQLQNEAQMLMNQARNLDALDYNALTRLRRTLATTEGLLAEAQGLAYQVQRLDEEIARLYPTEYATTSADRIAQDAQERWRQGLEGLRTTMRLQAQAATTLAEDEAILSDLVEQSQSATGALQAAQATNQLLALQAKQQIQAQQLQLVQDRALALELARQSAAVEKARELRRRFMGAGTPYTPYPVRFHGH